MITVEKLTPKGHMQLPAGTYIVSFTFCGPPWKPTFEEPVATAGTARQEQWTRIKDADLAGCKCHLFRDHSEYRRWHYVAMAVSTPPWDAPSGCAYEKHAAERAWMVNEVAPPGLG